MSLNMHELLNELQSPYRRIDSLTRSRVRRIAQGKEFFSLPDDAKLFLHLIPCSEQPFVIDKRDAAIRDLIRNLSLPFSEYLGYQRINVDGYFASDSRLDSTPISSYYQLYWNSGIEYGTLCPVNKRAIEKGEVRTIHAPELEHHIVRTLQSATRFLQQAQAPLPLRVSLSLVDAAGYQLTTQWYAFPEDHAIDRDELFFKPVMLENWDADYGTVLRPVFDALWNAGNYQFSGSYTESGEWKPRIQ